MTEEPHAAAASPEQYEHMAEPHTPQGEEVRLPPNEMRLRAEHPGVTRLSRRILVGAVSSPAAESVLL